MKTNKTGYQINYIISAIFTGVCVISFIMYLGWKLRDSQVESEIDNAKTEGYLTGLKDAQNGTTSFNIESDTAKHVSSTLPKVKERKALVKR